MLKLRSVKVLATSVLITSIFIYLESILDFLKVYLGSVAEFPYMTNSNPTEPS
jgi:hypothetical protein